jgi:hypothetical protein
MVIWWSSIRRRRSRCLAIETARIAKAYLEAAGVAFRA